jgi:IclR family acetate operon transcriptional repressor
MEQLFQKSPGSQAIDRGAQLLALILEAEAPLGVSELAVRTDLPKSTVSRVMGAFERNGLVSQDGDRGRFQAGPLLVRFARRGAGGQDLAELAAGPMHVLADATGETITLGAASRGGVDHLAQVESRHFIGATQWMGRHVPLHASANGKVLLAFGAATLPPDAPLEPRTSRTIVEPARLAAELETVRRDGWATSVDELEVGLSAIAAPVLEASGRAVAALSVSGPTLRLSPRRVDELRLIVIKQARALSERLGHRPEGVQAA